MQSTHQSAHVSHGPISHDPISHNQGPAASRKREDLVYQLVTVAAILMLIGSVWIF
jgi:hypothetical protein